MNAVQVDSGGEEVGVASQTERRQKAAITAAPQPDPGLVDVAARTQVMRGGHNVLIFRGPAPAPLLGLPKRAAIADAQTIVDRQDRITTARQILIEAVGVVVVVHIVPAEHHLPARATVHKDHRRQFVARLCVFGKEELAVDFEAVGGFEENWLWFDELFRREDILASETHALNLTYQISFRIYLVEGRSDYSAWNECVSLKITEIFPITCNRWLPLNRLVLLRIARCSDGTGGQRIWLASGYRNTPEMAAINVIVI